VKISTLETSQAGNVSGAVLIAVLVALATACCGAQKQDKSQLVPAADEIQLPAAGEKPGEPPGRQPAPAEPAVATAEADAGTQVPYWQRQLDAGSRQEAQLEEASPDSPEPTAPLNPWQAAAGPDAPSYTVTLGTGGPQLLDGAGLLLMDLAPELRFSGSRSSSESTLRTVPLPALVWERSAKEGKWAATGVSEEDPYRVTLRYSGMEGDPRIFCEATVEHTGRFYPQVEALSYVTGAVGNGFVLHRDQQVRRIDAAFQLDPWTYKLAFFGRKPSSVAFVGGFGIPSARLAAETDGSYALDIELDHAGNHPFEVYEGCHDKTSTKHPKQQMGRQVRRPGESRSYSFMFVAGNPTPVRISRLPRGYRAALSFTDHADQSSTEKLAALLYGDSKADPTTAVGGFIGHNLGFTKTVFAINRGSYSPQLERSDYHRLLATAVGLVDSFEVGSHSPSGLRDNPGETLPSLERLHGFQRGGSSGEPVGMVWIDHQPDTNCEAVTNLGWNPDSEWFMLDGLAKLGFRYFWAGHDVKLRAGRLNMLKSAVPDARVSLLYSNNRFSERAGQSEGLYLWPSFWTFSKRDRFYGLFSDEALLRLIDEEGIHIAHSYLDSFRRKGRFKNRSHFVRRNKRLVMRPEMDERLQRMEELQAKGDLWVAGIGVIGDHLLKLPEIDLEYTPEGKCRITNRGSRKVANATFFLPSMKGRPRITIDGRTVAVRSSHGRKFFWLDLGAGESVELALSSNEGGGVVPLIVPVQLKVVVQ